MTAHRRADTTFSHQHNLPRLPIPDLDETCDRFLDWVAPLIDAESFEQTRLSVNDFRRPGGPGPVLQRALASWAQDRPNWLEPWWDDTYLRARAPLPINGNYVLLPKDPPQGAPSQLEQAARLIVSLVTFKRRLDTEELMPDYLGDRPLCMHQFRRLFSTTRVPQRGSDSLRSPMSGQHPTPRDAKHIIVLSKGHLFTVDVLTSADEIRSPADLIEDLHEITANAEPPASAPVGLLTTLDRDGWSDARERLMALDPHNAYCLDTVETALFAVCLDDDSPADDGELTRLALHGDGRNRWFDKSLQVIVSRNARSALNGEHAGHDATTTLRLLSFVHADDGQAAGAPGGDANPPERLEFLLDEPLRETLHTAAGKFEALVADTRIGLLDFDVFGKDTMKSLGVGPDTFVQLALQAAQHRLFGRNRSTYESVMTRVFRHGRTEAMRSVTPEVVRFAEALAAMRSEGDPEGALDTALHALRDAATAHRDRVATCQTGHGVDRHLFGCLSMHEICGAQLGIPAVPAVFASPGWVTMRHDILSTSNGSSDALDLFCFGPVNDDGFGVAYVIQPQRIVFAVSCRTAMQESLTSFLAYLRESLLAMSDVLEHG